MYLGPQTYGLQARNIKLVLDGVHAVGHSSRMHFDERFRPLCEVAPELVAALPPYSGAYMAGVYMDPLEDVTRRLRAENPVCIPYEGPPVSEETKKGSNIFQPRLSLELGRLLTASEVNPDEYKVDERDLLLGINIVQVEQMAKRWARDPQAWTDVLQDGMRAGLRQAAIERLGFWERQAFCLRLSLTDFLRPPRRR